MLLNKRLTYLVLFAIGISAPLLLRTSFLRGLLVLTLIFAMLSLSLDVIISGTGQMSFGHQAFFALGAYASALSSVKLGLTPFAGFLAAFIGAGLAGLFVGYLASRATRGVYFAIVTLGFSVILLVLFRYFVDITGGMSGISNIPPPVISLPGAPNVIIKSEISYYYLALFLTLFEIYLITRWQRSRFGRGAAALRENEILASSIGISPVKIYTMTFVLATALAGLSGALYAHYLHFITPHLFGLHYILIILVILFVGGAGTMGGPVLGALFYVFMQELIPIEQEIVFFIFGLTLLTFILFMPQGMYPFFRSIVVNYSGKYKNVDRLKRSYLIKKNNSF